MKKPISNKKKIALTFDLELWHEGEWLQPYISQETRKNDAFHESVDPLLDFLRAADSRATFFVTDTVANKYPEEIARISGEGHEIASHSFRHTRLQNLSPDEFRSGMVEHTNRLEKIAGKKILGFRAPHFSLSSQTSWSLDILADMGYRYDSSIFPVRTPEYGMKAPLHPYRISSRNVSAEDESGRLTEIPIPAFQIFSFRMPAGGGIYFRLLPLFIFKWTFRKAAQKNSLPILYFHPHELCSSTPRIKGPFLRTMLKYWGTKKSLRKLQKLSRDFEFDSVRNMLNL